MQNQPDISLYDALNKRNSSRVFSGEEISEKALKSILWAAVGMNRDAGGCTVPMPLGDPVVKLYVASQQGVDFYDAEKDTLKNVLSEDIRGHIAYQDFVSKASHVVILTGLFDRYPDNIGEQERRDWTYTTAGMAMQNIHLAAVANDIGTVAVAWIKHGNLQQELPLVDDERPIFIMPLGN